MKERKKKTRNKNRRLWYPGNQGKNCAEKKEMTNSVKCCYVRCDEDSILDSNVEVIRNDVDKTK